MRKEEIYKDFIYWAGKFGEIGELKFYMNGEPFIRAGYNEVKYSDYLTNNK